MEKLTAKILNEVTKLYFESENVMKKDGGWPGHTAFYNPDGDNVYLSKISIDYKAKKVPSEKVRIAKLKEEIKKRFNDPGWGVKKGIESHYKLQLRLAQKIVGKLLWYSKRDGNGIIKTINDREFYFDKSVVTKSLLKLLENNEVKFLKFNKNSKISDCLCACDVQSFKSKNGKIENLFENKNELEDKMRKLSSKVNKLDSELEDLDRKSREIKMKNVRMY